LQSTYELYNKKMAVEKERQGRVGEPKRGQRGQSAVDKLRSNRSPGGAKARREQEQEEQLRALYVHSKEAMVKLEGPRGYCHVPECRLRALAPSDYCLSRTF
jgi:hypothetical protein